MAIESTGMDIAARHGLAGQGGQGKHAARGDEWLAALERSSFELSDDSLRTPAGAGVAALENLHNPVPRPPSIPGVEPSTGSSGPAAAPGTPAPPASAGPPGVAAPSVSPPSMATGSGSLPTGLPNRVHQAPLAQSFVQLAGSAPGASHRFRALLNQASFIDVNLQLTQSNEGPVLWIRDFKQKYSEELQHWIKDLQAVLAEQGQSLSRIMLNGQPIKQLSDISGR